MHPYRTHTCNELRVEDAGKTARLSGWVFHKRDHGGILFLDLRDHYGRTQVVVHPSRPFFQEATDLRLESVVTVTGQVVARGESEINPDIDTGRVELVADEFVVESAADQTPIYLAGDGSDVGGEDLRLKYRYLDLRRESLHKNIVLRSKVISFLRRRMEDLGFREYQTPILTSSSPEGARDFLVPSRIHPGEFYALPQAPQIYKQLLMVAGFDRYFQIAPCFRDEDARADRSPGEFYQLDMEMSYATQDDVFAVMEDVIPATFREFAPAGTKVDGAPFVRIPYREAMMRFGTDKPDLRNPLEWIDMSGQGRGEAVPHVVRQARAQREGERRQGPRLHHLDGRGRAQGADREVPHARAARGDEGPRRDGEGRRALLHGRARGGVPPPLGARPHGIEKDAFRFCWIVDFPFFETDEETGALIFSHNPFSMPQGGMEALTTKNPLDIVAYQYDIVCNGIELSSGAVRNHRTDVMLKAFELCGYPAQEVYDRFPALANAFKYGAPPHAGVAPGVDRMVMLLTGSENIREVIAFPMNQKAQEPMMNSPHPVSEKQLRELHIKVRAQNVAPNAAAPAPAPAAPQA